MSKSKRIIITLNDMKQEALSKLMKEDLENNVSAYIGRMITQEVLMRKEEKLLALENNI